MHAFALFQYSIRKYLVHGVQRRRFPAAFRILPVWPQKVICSKLMMAASYSARTEVMQVFQSYAVEKLSQDRNQTPAV
jgi:hypothetical protein